MTEEALQTKLVEADIEIKKQQAELLKAQVRLADAQTKALGK